MAFSLFTLVPVELFKLSVNLQSSITAGITSYGTGFSEMAVEIIAQLGTVPVAGAATANGVFDDLSTISNPIMLLFIIIMMRYAVIKVFC